MEEKRGRTNTLLYASICASSVEKEIMLSLSQQCFSYLSHGRRIFLPARKKKLLLTPFLGGKVTLKVRKKSTCGEPMHFSLLFHGSTTTQMSAKGVDVASFSIFFLIIVPIVFISEWRLLNTLKNFS